MGTASLPSEARPRDWERCRSGTLRRGSFSSREAVRELDSPPIAVLDIPYYTQKLKDYLDL